MRAINSQKSVLILSCFLFCSVVFGHGVKNDSLKIDYEKIYAFCLDGNIAPALMILKKGEFEKLPARDLKFKTGCHSRNVLSGIHNQNNINALDTDGIKESLLEMDTR